MLNELFDNKIKLTEKNDIHYVNKNQAIDENKNINKVKNFIQELLTSYSPVLKPEYGTEFVNSLGEIVNPYKFQYFLEKEATKISYKYDIEHIEISKIDSSGNLLIGHLEININGNKFSHEFEIDWNGKTYTTEAIIE